MRHAAGDRNEERQHEHRGRRHGASPRRATSPIVQCSRRGRLRTRRVEQEHEGNSMRSAPRAQQRPWRVHTPGDAPGEALAIRKRSNACTGIKGTQCVLMMLRWPGRCAKPERQERRHDAGENAAGRAAREPPDPEVRCPKPVITKVIRASGLCDDRPPEHRQRNSRKCRRRGNSSPLAMACANWIMRTHRRTARRANPPPRAWPTRTAGCNRRCPLPTPPVRVGRIRTSGDTITLASRRRKHSAPRWGFTSPHNYWPGDG